MVKYLSFHNSSFALRYFFNVNGKASVTHLVLLLCKHEAFVAPLKKGQKPICANVNSSGHYAANKNSHHKDKNCVNSTFQVS
jgi:hypothetical protein